MDWNVQLYGSLQNIMIVQQIFSLIYLTKIFGEDGLTLTPSMNFIEEFKFKEIKYVGKFYLI